MALCGMLHSYASLKITIFDLVFFFQDEHGNKLPAAEKKVEEVKTGGNPYRRKKEKTADDEIRILHEAYQFLLKRLVLVLSSRSYPDKIPYARHYKPRLVYFFTPFPKTIYVL